MTERYHVATLGNTAEMGAGPAWRGGFESVDGQFLAPIVLAMR
jgi:hypothetical protein